MKKLSYKVRVTELDDVSNRLLEVYKKASTLKNDTFLKPLFAEIQKQSDQITEAIKRDVAVSNLEEADQKRDQAVRNLHNVLVGYRSMPIENLKKSAERLYEVFSKYGVKIVNENYASESALIEALLLDLASSDLREAINALTGVPECIAKLRTEQDYFNKVRADYGTAVVAQGQKSSASALKRPLLELINAKLITYLITMTMVNPEQYKAFSDLVSEIVEGMNIAIKRREKEEKQSTTVQPSANTTPIV